MSFFLPLKLNVLERLFQKIKQHKQAINEMEARTRELKKRLASIIDKNTATQQTPQS